MAAATSLAALESHKHAADSAHHNNRSGKPVSVPPLTDYLYNILREIFGLVIIEPCLWSLVVAYARVVWHLSARARTSTDRETIEWNIGSLLMCAGCMCGLVCRVRAAERKTNYEEKRR